MNTLKELISHCNNTDKAPMLDEAIEYLKALQLQLQVMWMGSGMAPMMFPGALHYLSTIGMAMGSSTNQNIMSQTPITNPVSYQSRMQNPAFQEQFARILALHNLQTSTQPMNMFRFGPQMIPHPQTTGLCNGGPATEDAVKAK